MWVTTLPTGMSGGLSRLLRLLGSELTGASRRMVLGAKREVTSSGDMPSSSPSPMATALKKSSTCSLVRFGMAPRASWQTPMIALALAAVNLTRASIPWTQVRILARPLRQNRLIKAIF